MVGDIVEVEFSFADLTGQKTRPAVVLANAGGRDWILCQLTSNIRGRPGDIRVTNQDMQSGSLLRNSWARVGHVQTFNIRVFQRTFGHLTDAKRDEIVLATRNLFNLPAPPNAPPARQIV